MRSTFSVLLDASAGFFIYVAGLLSFVNDPNIGSGKWWILLVFCVPALTALAASLALHGLPSWRRKTGVVLLSASGVTAFCVLTFACLGASPTYRASMKPETMRFFSDYTSGALVNLGVGALGLFLLTAFKARRSSRASFGGSHSS